MKHRHLEQRDSWIYLGFSDGVLWNYTHDFDTALAWLDEGKIETFAKFSASYFWSMKED